MYENGLRFRVNGLGARPGPKARAYYYYIILLFYYYYYITIIYYYNASESDEW